MRVGNPCRWGSQLATSAMGARGLPAVRSASLLVPQTTSVQALANVSWRLVARASSRLPAPTTCSPFRGDDCLVSRCRLEERQRSCQSENSPVDFARWGRFMCRAADQGHWPLVPRVSVDSPCPRRSRDRRGWIVSIQSINRFSLETGVGHRPRNRD